MKTLLAATLLAGALTPAVQPRPHPGRGTLDPAFAVKTLLAAALTAAQLTPQGRARTAAASLHNLPAWTDPSAPEPTPLLTIHTGEMLAAFEAIEKRATTGHWPSTTPNALNAAATRLDPTAGHAYLNYRPAPYPRLFELAH